MAWTAPMTAVANVLFSSTDWNTSVRDNMLEMAPAKITAAGEFIRSAGAKQLMVTRFYDHEVVASQAIGTAGSFVDLATVGPTVTFDRPINTLGVLVMFGARMTHSSANNRPTMSVAFSGAGTSSPVAASDNWAAFHDGIPAGEWIRSFSCHYFSSTTFGSATGSLTVTCKYKSTNLGSSYANRFLTVFPF